MLTVCIFFGLPIVSEAEICIFAQLFTPPLPRSVMPKDISIKSVLIIGSGPIIIGQACEFDYSGSQAARSLREEGIEVTLINNNPATIMTDPVTADHIHLKPLTVESIIEILENQHIDAVLPTMGGQTALNLAKEAQERGVWETRGTGGKSRTWLERIRTGTPARRQRQCGHHLHGRKPRPDGHPHRRLHHRGPCHDLSTRPIRTCATSHQASCARWAISPGGCNVQFAQNPETEELIAIEINPRVSRSSALASKATGYPIAKIAAKLAIGYNLDELKNQITKTTSAYFEPTLDYVIVKMPRWNFDKFHGADHRLGLQMKSVGEVMAIGRSFNEALQKACQSQENNRTGLGADKKEWMRTDDILERLEKVSDDRIYRVKDALRLGIPPKPCRSSPVLTPGLSARSKTWSKMEEQLLRYNVAEIFPPIFSSN
jgi:carbamoylphosphate synthase large subunit